MRIFKEFHLLLLLDKELGEDVEGMRLKGVN